MVRSKKKVAPKKAKAASPDVKVHSIIRDNEIADAMGFDGRTTLFSLTERATDGRTEAGYRLVREKFNRLPGVVEGLETLEKHSKAEETREELIYPGKIMMRPNGQLLTPTSMFRTTPDILKEIVTKMQKQSTDEVYAGSHLCSIAPAERAMEFARQAWNWKTASGESKSAFKIATRNGRDGGRTCFRVSSEGYLNFPPHRIASVVKAVVADHPDLAKAKVQISYNGDRSQIDILWFNPHGVDEAGCGDIFQFGCRIQSSEEKNGKLKTFGILYNNSCLNYVIVEVKEKQFGEQKHYGRIDMGAELKTMIGKALEECDPMLKAWHEGSRERLDEMWGVTKPGDVFKQLNARGFGVVEGLDEDENIKQLVKAAEFRGGEMTRTWAVDAITRRAHTVTWPGASRFTVIDGQEKQGGKLLTVSVLN